MSKLLQRKSVLKVKEFLQYVDQSIELIELEEELEVRWFSYLPTGWKLHPILNSIENYDELTILVILSPDLTVEETEKLQKELIESGIDVVSCGYTDCVINLENSESNQLYQLLVDDRIIWIEPSISYVLTNAQAAEQSGVQQILSNWNSGLNGSGETVSIVDTGLDMDHSDYTSQLIAVQNGFGLDNNPADSISGHGTHVTGTLLGDGSGEPEAMGIAPAATLRKPSFTIDCAKTVAVVVPSPAKSLVLEATSFTI